jgi:mannose-6-phosphate isomerase class I
LIKFNSRMITDICGKYLLSIKADLRMIINKQQNDDKENFREHNGIQCIQHLTFLYINDADKFITKKFLKRIKLYDIVSDII